MALLEIMTVTVGNAVAKWIFSAWLGEGLGKELAGSTTDLITARVPDFLQRRRLDRQAALIAETSAAKLSRVIAVEYGQLPPNEQESAAAAVQDSLNAALQSINLIALDLDAVRLKDAITSTDPRRPEHAGLSESATHLYMLLLSEASNHIVEVITTLPQFSSIAATELLRRETAVIDLVNTVLQRLPDPQVIANNLEASLREFETNYRRYIARRYDRLELFGLSVSEMSSRYALSVAYITLSAKGKIKARASDNLEAEELEIDGKIGIGKDVDSLRIDEAIQASLRTFVRGAAGSGKTTLLQWIAVRSARNEFHGDLQEWNDRIPFFIQLRRFSDGALPSPNEFLKFAGSTIAERAPNGWVAEQMTNGRAIILIDGVDEVADGDRPKVKHWLDDLTAAYPDSRYVVTSRPSAVSEGWLQTEGFSSVELQPMTLSDIKSFISHWHEAASSSITENEELASLSRFHSKLIDAISTSHQLRNLATSPLLCAMLCALNRERRTKLPRDRVELYRIALEMLLERRDLEREIGSEQRLSLPEKLILLQEFAYWLVLNEQSDATYQIALDRFAHRLQFMPDVKLSAEEVVRFMLVRSGLLREPIPGRIDFIHRTFQEYLAAVEVVELGNIPMLVSRAAEDNWREVVVLAAGACHRSQREVLFRGLIDRGHKDVTNRHTLWLVAVACVETAREVSPAIRREIFDCLGELLPPQNMSEAKALSSAGELALDALEKFKSARATEVAACIRTATLVGGEASLHLLSNYSNDNRITVQRALLRAWQLHDMPEQYAETVLADAHLVRGDVTLSDASLLPHVKYLKNLKRLSFIMRNKPFNTEYFRNLPQLTSFDARLNGHISTIDFLENNTELTFLDLEDCEHVNDIRVVKAMKNLSLLDISGTAVRDLSPVGNSLKLDWFSGRQLDIDDWSALEGLTNLNYVDVRFNTNITTLDFARHWTKLAVLRCDRTSVRSLDAIAGIESLHQLTAGRCDNLVDIAAIGSLSGLSALILSNVRSVSTLAPIGSAPNLTDISVTGNSQLTGFDVLASSKFLTRFQAAGCTKLMDIEFLKGKEYLHHVTLQDTSVRDISPLAGARMLSSLSLSGLANLASLEPLAELPNLRTLTLRGIPKVDLSQLTQSEDRKLRVLVDRNTELIGIESFKKAGGSIMRAQNRSTLRNPSNVEQI